jgi:hypothetical protein
LALANKLSSHPHDIAREAAPDLATWPEAKEIAQSKKNQPPILKHRTQPKSAIETSKSPRSAVDLNVLREIRRQFRNQKTWHSPVEIQESALYGLMKGLKLSRVVVMEENGGFWQAFDNEGCQQYPLLRNIKLPMQSSEILTELSKRVTAIWVNDSNRAKAGRLLPPPLMAAADDESFFLRSFSIGQNVTMLLYADGYGLEESLNATDYQLFREYCADWNTALNKMRL